MSYLLIVRILSDLTGGSLFNLIIKSYKSSAFNPPYVLFD